MAEIIKFPGQLTRTTQEAIDYFNNLDLEEIIIVGTDKEGQFHVSGGQVSSRDALFLLMLAKKFILDEVEV